MNRREFLRNSAALAGIAEPLSDVNGKLPARQLGNTGETVSILALGGGQRFYQTRNEEEAVRFVVQAVEAGITSHDSPAGMKLALERHDFDCCQMALNAAMADMIGANRPVTAGDRSFEALALPGRACRPA